MNIKKIIIVGTTKVDKLSKKHKQYTMFVKRNRKKTPLLNIFCAKRGECMGIFAGLLEVFFEQFAQLQISLLVGMETIFLKTGGVYLAGTVFEQQAGGEVYQLGLVVDHQFLLQQLVDACHLGFAVAGGIDLEHMQLGLGWR